MNKIVENLRITFKTLVATKDTKFFKVYCNLLKTIENEVFEMFSLFHFITVTFVRLHKFYIRILLFYDYQRKGRIELRNNRRYGLSIVII